MMLILLGLVDMFAAAILGLMVYGMVLKWIMIIFGIILLIKGIIFIKSPASIIDLSAGAVLILGVFFSIPSIVLWIAAILLVQKGIFSFF